jgi:hypothetical protein
MSPLVLRYGMWSKILLCKHEVASQHQTSTRYRRLLLVDKILRLLLAGWQQLPRGLSSWGDDENHITPAATAPLVCATKEANNELVSSFACCGCLVSTAKWSRYNVERWRGRMLYYIMRLTGIRITCPSLLRTGRLWETALNHYHLRRSSLLAGAVAVLYYAGRF